MKIIFFILTIIVIVGAVSTSCSQEVDKAVNNDDQSVKTTNIDNNTVEKRQWPKLFDFNLFVTRFGRKYQGHLEAVKRKAIYMANSIKVFFHNILWSKGTTQYYLKIGPLTDFTEDELDQVYSEHDNSKSATHRPTLAIDELKLKEQFETIIDTHTPEIIAEAIEDRLEADSKQHRFRRSSNDAADAPETNHRMIPDEIGEFQSRNQRPRRKMLYDIPESEKNPHYQMPMIFSRTSGQDKTDPLVGTTLKEISNELRNVMSEQNHDNNLIISALSKFFPQLGGANSDQSQEEKNKNVEIGVDDKDKVYYDWRDCLPTTKDQGRCGSCWAFAGTAKLEYEHCRQKGELVKLSEQYYVDCAPSISSYAFGCQGADLFYVANLINILGVESNQYYPYEARQGQCPHSLDTKIYTMGRMRPTVSNITEKFWPFDIDYHLKNGPVLISLRTPSDFSLYGGGVHSGKTCDPNRGHAVLVVGDGIQDGAEYWLIRNSHGDDWGEAGHIKISKKAPEICWKRIVDWDTKFPNMLDTVSSKFKLAETILGNLMRRKSKS